MKIILCGNPNVGKSVLFSRLTGVEVVISNYPGTTVEYKKGYAKINDREVEIIDVPGIYSISADSEAGKVAIEMLKQADVIINVIDVTNLERNLFLTLQLLEMNVPLIIAMNFWNETRHKGIDVDVKKLEALLDVPAVPIVAVTGEGIKEIVERLDEAKPHNRKNNYKQRWEKIGRIVGEVQIIKNQKHSLLQRLEDFTIYPLTGLPFAIFVLVAVFSAIRIIGEGLIKYLLDPLFNIYLVMIERLSLELSGTFWHDLLIGHLINDRVDFVQSMGMLSTGIYVPIVMILPYIVSFYLALGILEDSGYLPRLSALVDNIMHKVGLHGIAIIPMMLGCGCKVPGMLSTRILETRRQRLIAITLTAISIPCMAQTSIIFGLLGRYGIQGLGTVFLTLASVWVVLGVILHKTTNGEIPETFIEIPPYRIPNANILIKKLTWRLKGFVFEAIPYMLLGIVMLNIFYMSGIIDITGNIVAPVLSGVFGLPKEAVVSIVIGFLRKDVAMSMLLPLGLTMKQMIIASVLVTMYFPCIATFMTILKELGPKDTIKLSLITIASTLIVGGMLNLIL